MRFSKYHGTGNDFLLVEDLDDRSPVPAALVAAACDRHTGVGADGVIRIVRGDGLGGASADFFMDYWNADGTVAQMCGNGIRTLGKYVFDRGLTTKTRLQVATRAGIRRLSLEVADGRVTTVTVDMGEPAFERKALPMAGDPTSTFLGGTWEVAGRAFPAAAVSMGNPHCVLFVHAGDDLDALPVRELGSLVERDERFPEGTNVEFVQVLDRDHLRVRVWERGSGETLACGTGACAALVTAAASGAADREAAVDFPGGRLRIAWGEDDHVMLTGPAAWVFDGELSPEFERGLPGAGAAG